MTLRVVMVDDEEDLVWSTVQSLKRERPACEVEGFTDPIQALECIERSPPDLLITDLRMPGMNGVDLLLAARRRTPRLPAILITAYGGAQVVAEVHRRGGVEYLEKPFSFAALCECVDRQLARLEGFSGAISLPLLPDLIQIYTLSMASGALTITRGVERGVIWFEQGAMVDALCGSERGEAAVYRLLRWESGSFALDPAARAERRTIESSWQEVLLEGCRLLDEDERAAPESPMRSAADMLSALGWDEGQARSSAVFCVDLAVRARNRFDSSAGAEGASDGWEAAVDDLLQVVERLVDGPTEVGAIELVGDEFGVAVTWNRRAQAAAVLATEVKERVDVARFRSQVARLSARQPMSAISVQ